jgi:hypothetical protein
MKGKVQKRSDAEKSVVCELIRVSDDRVIAECECGFSMRDGPECDHAVLLAQQGGKAHIIELYPYRSRTAAWQLQYPLDYKPKMPTETDMEDMSTTDAVHLREESGVGTYGESQLMAVVAMKRNRGRPSKKDCQRCVPLVHDCCCCVSTRLCCVMLMCAGVGSARRLMRLSQVRSDGCTEGRSDAQADGQRYRGISDGGEDAVHQVLPARTPTPELPRPWVHRVARGYGGDPYIPPA